MTTTITATPKRVAIIGGGISGLAAARLLSKAGHRITLFEAEPRLGGHARTVVAGKRGDQPVDTGFIVFNRLNYPNLCALFGDLSVPVAKSDMSFGASIDGGRLEYGFGTLAAVFAQKRNAFDPRYLGMLRDIFRFNARARSVADDPAMPLRALLDRIGTGAWFRDYYLLPLTGAIWSTPLEQALDFPAEALVRFFDNHALLSHTGQHQWYTVQGGSVEYVRRLERALVAGGVELRMFTPVQSVRRSDTGAEIKTHAAPAEAFDEVVFATHSDDSLRLLSDPMPEERRALSAVRYQPNRAVLHADTTVMPRRKAAWASWVYTEASGQRADRIGLTYWMNSLQPIPKDDPLFVTLNSNRTIREELIFDQVTFRHPVFDVAALRAQDEIRALNGQRDTWFCGAWMRNGFHEDGFASAVDVADAMARRAAQGRVAA